ncbi:meiosis regulator and mRNA stability factor 1-like isoform X2 [Tubulanus polymorphus]|uniref:meiosis regulator and mRNA stability factor 1-like isoform X2 n=1 Tax=Tubulanus polymorphus TaxID=672921 RepID=UPI003DA25844
MSSSTVSEGTVLPPIGVFWDIENCNVPRGKSALNVVNRIRELFFAGFREVEFLCVCDISKENRDVIEELNNAQVTVVHINATSKNAADDKLRQCLRRFSDTYTPPATVILISGDVNFASELSDLRHRHGFRIVVIHNKNVPDALLACAHIHHAFEKLVTDLPEKQPRKSSVGAVELLVTQLPVNQPIGALRNRLKRLSDNCGGKVISINSHTCSAIIKFQNLDSAARAKKRMDGEDVFNSVISVDFAPAEQKKEASNNSTIKPEKVITPRRRRRHKSVPSTGNRSKQETSGNLNDGNPGNSNQTDSHKETTKRKNPKSQPSPERQVVENATAAGDDDDDDDLLDQVDQFPMDSGPFIRPPSRLDGSGDWRPPSRHDNDALMYGRPPSRHDNDGILYGGRPPSSEFVYHRPGSCGPMSGRIPTPSGELHHTPSPSFYQKRNSLQMAQMYGGEDRRYSPHSNTSTPDFYYRDLPHYSRPHSYPYSSPRTSPACFTGGRITPRSGVYDYHGYANHGNNFFRPIRSRGNSPVTRMTPSPSPIMHEYSQSPSCVQGVELTVTNLDYNISPREWRKILYSTFVQSVQVLNVYIQTQNDGSNIGIVCVPNIDEARLAIAQFHRKKIGYKRIHVTLVRTNNTATQASLRSESIAILKDVTGQTLPLFKFIELFEKRFHKTVSVSELYKMRDVLEITDSEGSGRNISLVHRNTTDSPNLQDPIDKEVEEIFESPVCKTHCCEGTDFYMEALNSESLPNVQLQLRSFAPQLHTLLQAHNGYMPMMSFPACYAAEFGPVHPVSEGGVPLEHLISAVPGVQLSISKSGVKKVHWAENKPPSPSDFMHAPSQSPALSQQLYQLSKEIVDLLKSCPQCRMPFCKFIPAYHHHFGRQCRVADYGYTKLAELFEALPHVLQVMGTGNRRILTLTHRAQVKRFTSDLLRLLKAQTTKQLKAIEIPGGYFRTFNKMFDMTEYGVCYLEDILAEIPESTITVFGTGEEMLIRLPTRDQTPEEAEKTKIFCQECVDLLRHSPQCRMPFNKFIPSYHHHFGRQCKVSEYGYTKLLDLFENIPDVIQIVDDGDEKVLCLTEPELIKVLADQVMSLLNSFPMKSLPAREFLTAFMRFHGHSLQLQDFSVHNVLALMKKISHIVKVEDNNGQTVISLLDRSNVQNLVHKLLIILLDDPTGSITISALKYQFFKLYSEPCDIDLVRREMTTVVNVNGDDESGTIKLNCLLEFSRDLRSLLRQHNGKMPLQHFENAYANHFGVDLKPDAYGLPSVTALLMAVPLAASIKGRGFKRMIHLCPDFLDKLSHQMAYSPPVEDDSGSRRDSNDTPSKDSGININPEEDEELMQIAFKPPSPIDLLQGRIPSAIPCPGINPKVPTPVDLIRFTHSPLPIIEAITMMSEDEKNRQRSPLVRTPVSDLLQFTAQYIPGSPQNEAASTRLYTDAFGGQYHLPQTPLSVYTTDNPGKAILAMISPPCSTPVSARSLSPGYDKSRSDCSSLDENNEHVRNVLALLSPLKPEGTPDRSVVEAIPAESVGGEIATKDKDRENESQQANLNRRQRRLDLDQELVATVEGEIVENFVAYEDVAPTLSDGDKSSFVKSIVTPFSALTVDTKTTDTDIKNVLAMLSPKNTPNHSDIDSDLDSSRSTHSSHSPKSGTPKKSRIAAKFVVPIEQRSS